MSTTSVLSGATALRQFTVAQLAAYCDADHEEISRVLHQSQGMVVRVDSPGSGHQVALVTDDIGGQQWRVVHPQRLRELLTRDRLTSPDGPQGRARPSAGDAPEQLRLLRAEETLFDCSGETSPQIRRTMAATAMNYLQQYVAATTDRQDWWEIELRAERCETDPARQVTPGPGRRLWVDVALANLTESQARGERVGWEFLIKTASQVCSLVGSRENPRLREVVDCFVKLAGDLTHLSVDDSPRAPAPTRLLSTLGWRRVKVQIDPDVEGASHDVLALLRWLQDRPPATDADRHRLFRFDDHRPDGLNQITVYSHLLQLLPRHCKWQRRDELVPGVLVEVVADASAADHLDRCARTLEHDLVGAPWGSDSALIGITAQVIGELAASNSHLDHEVGARCITTKTELLGLANVRTRTSSLPSERPAQAPSGGRG